MLALGTCKMGLLLSKTEEEAGVGILGLRRGKSAENHGILNVDRLLCLSSPAVLESRTAMRCRIIEH